MRIEMAPVSASAETIALEALAFVVANDDEISRFLALSGLSVDTLRSSAGTPETMRAVLEYVMGHEPTAKAFAQSQGYRPEELAAAAHRLGAL